MTNARDIGTRTEFFRVKLNSHSFYIFFYFYSILSDNAPTFKFARDSKQTDKPGGIK